MQNFTSEIHPNTPISKIWLNINRFCGLKSRHDIHCLSKLNDQTTNIQNRNDIANTLCSHWSEATLDTNFPALFRQHKSISRPLNTLIPSPLALNIEKDITMVELLAALNQLKGKTPARDRITYPMLKNLPLNLLQRLLNLFNNILNTQIPQQFKVSCIIPIPKPNMNKTSINAYRPISLNPCIAKILDKIIARRLWWIATNGNLLKSRQMGFRKGKSVYDCLAVLDYHTTSSLSTKSHASIISLDFAKAFDRVGIHSIIDELIEWKIGPRIIKYISNFLTNRKITVLANNVYSSQQPLNNGIPQGSPLSVILFATVHSIC